MMNQQDIKVLLDVQKQFIEDLDDHTEERLAYIEDWVLTDSDPRVDPEEQKKIVDIDTKKLPLSTQLETNFARLYANGGVKTCASALYHGRLSDDQSKSGFLSTEQKMFAIRNNNGKYMSRA